MQDLLIIQNELNAAKHTEEEPFPLDELRQLEQSVGEKSTSLKKAGQAFVPLVNTTVEVNAS